MRAISVLLIVGLCLSAAASMQSPSAKLAQVPIRGGWTNLAPMPAPRQELSTAVLDGKIFAIAGFTGAGDSTNNVYVYTPETNAWTEAAPLPIANNHNASAVAAGKLYAFGGVSNRCFVYDPINNQWTDVAPMRFQHANTAAVGVINNRIYVAGGNGPNMNQTELEVYDPAQNTWTLLAPMSVPRNHTAGGVIDGKFYVVGGRPSDEAAGTLEVYNPATNQWARLRDMPTGRSGIGAAAINGELYVFGGEIPRQFSEVEVYNPLTNLWQQLPPMPTPRHGIFAAVIGNKVYLPGGATNQGLAATNIQDVFTVNTATTVSAASFTAQVAPKSIVSAFGLNFATVTASAPTQPLPTDLAGVTVDVTDATGVTRLAPLFFVSPLQINYQIPAETAQGPAVISVTGSDGAVSTGALQILFAAPAIFTFNQNGSGPAVALDGFRSNLAPFDAKAPNGQPNIIAFFGTGLGADATDVNDNRNFEVPATIDGSLVTVQYAGRAPGFTGLNQFNLVLPATITSGTHTVQVARNDVLGNPVTIEVK